MPVRRILELGDPLLLEKSQPVVSLAGTALVLADLRDTLHEFRRTHGFGRGISAVQIGELRRAIYIEFEGRPYSILNPVVEWMSDGKIRLWDDCFSFPDLMVYVERAASMRIGYSDEAGEPQILSASGALSELLQHELDHLDGILAVHRACKGNSFRTRAEHKRRASSPLSRQPQPAVQGRR